MWRLIIFFRISIYVQIADEVSTVMARSLYSTIVSACLLQTILEIHSGFYINFLDMSFPGSKNQCLNPGPSFPTERESPTIPWPH